MFFKTSHPDVLTNMSVTARNFTQKPESLSVCWDVVPAPYFVPP